MIFLFFEGGRVFLVGLDGFERKRRIVSGSRERQQFGVRRIDEFGSFVSCFVAQCKSGEGEEEITSFVFHWGETKKQTNHATSKYGEFITFYFS